MWTNVIFMLLMVETMNIYTFCSNSKCSLLGFSLCYQQSFKSRNNWFQSLGAQRIRILTYYSCSISYSNCSYDLHRYSTKRVDNTVVLLSLWEILLTTIIASSLRLEIGFLSNQLHSSWMQALLLNQQRGEMIVCGAKNFMV